VVGEPWNARAIADKIGFTSVATQDIWADHRKKSAPFRRVAEKNPKTVKAVLKALHEASVWLDDLNNRPEQCEIVSKPTYIIATRPSSWAVCWAITITGDGRKLSTTVT